MARGPSHRRDARPRSGRTTVVAVGPWVIGWPSFPTNLERGVSPPKGGATFASFVCVLAADDDSGTGVGDSEALTHGPSVASGQDPGEGEDLHRLLRVRDQI